MSLPRGSDLVQSRETLAAVQRQLAEAVGRLDAVAARAAAVTDQADWRTGAAALFRANAEAWRRDVAALADDLAGAAERVRRDRARRETHAGWWGG